MIQIMKASAGSGKTFNLARKYITLLFRKKDKYAYRHVLAVTFTNKATDEMKNRILRELYILSSDPESSGYLKWFVPGRFSPEEMAGVNPDDIVRELPGRPGAEITLESLKESAKELLCNILHDYSAFSISTIDRFFQQTLKAFSREIGQFSSYQVELDKRVLIDECVDRILDSLTEASPELLDWLTDCAMEQVEKGERYNIDKKLSEMAWRLKSEAHREMVEKWNIDESEVYSYRNLRSLGKLCGNIVESFHGKVCSSAHAAVEAMHACGLEAGDFYRSFPKVLYDYSDIGNNDWIKAPDTFLKRAADRDSWFAKAGRQEKLGQSEGLEQQFGDFCRLFEDEYKVYNTAKLISGQLYELGVSADINSSFETVLRDKNVLSIDDSNLILKNIIDGSDAPFVYEKIGVRYENFLLDEFQDTSGIQWENFRPLLENSNAQGFDNLIVGDVKQSIYRWRGSEWKLLHRTLEEDMSPCRTDVLDSNFRSYGRVVEFNNMFFRYAASSLDMTYGSGNVISDIYSDVCQRTASKSGEQGLVDVSFCGKDSQTALVLKTVQNLHMSGAGYGDMAVLVRNNSSGARVAEYLIRHSVPVITDDSLKVKASGTVRKLASLMAYMDNPQDTVGSYLALSSRVSLPDTYRSLPDLCESLIRSLALSGEMPDGEATYVQSFMDCILDFVSKNGNSLHDFLAYWEDADPDVSSPALSDAVRIITVHKSKGLDFNYVIFPFAETVTLYRPTDVWCCPDFRDTPLEPAGTGLFDVNLSASCSATLFAGDYSRERLMQYIDNINVFYVALTRAVRGMHIIASTPSAKFVKSLDNDIPDFKDMSQILYAWLHGYGVRSGFRKGVYDGEDVSESYRAGEVPAIPLSKTVPRTVTVLPAGYPSYPLNPEPEAGEKPRNRLIFSTENSDYFSEEGKTGLYSSGRLRGIILHKILSSVKSGKDLEKAVSDAVAAGILDEKGGTDALAILSDKLSRVSSRGWFSETGAKVLNEVSLIDSDGSIFRPDRVLLHDDGKVTVIDYKFGAQENSHVRQILRYADIWRRKGYQDVSAYLWYVMDDEIVRAI